MLNFFPVLELLVQCKILASFTEYLWFITPEKDIFRNDLSN